MSGSRKVEMLKRTQVLAFVLTVLFMAIKAFTQGGAPGLPTEVLLVGLAGIGVNFGAFVVGNVLGDHKKNDPTPPAQ